ncbi:uncharacterized protein IL334_007122 [Kwoniella shivajii]|uniref:Uncharacterized protein n=1 Tax=Kwoniella shivajii TaxID=564305 RepID=A0ABZ1D8A4_9TREE|nr:hypothetical protein IL334_007122 [Kwoniella shivajii]
MPTESKPESDTASYVTAKSEGSYVTASEYPKIGGVDAGDTIEEPPLGRGADHRGCDSETNTYILPSDLQSHERNTVIEYKRQRKDFMEARGAWAADPNNLSKRSAYNVASERLKKTSDTLISMEILPPPSIYANRTSARQKEHHDD